MRNGRRAGTRRPTQPRPGASLRTVPPATPGSQPIAVDVAATVPTLPPPGQRWTTARAHRAVRTLVTSLVPGAADQRLTTAGAWIVLVARGFGAFLLGLAVLAIRARVKR